jgi:hypothetical protein
VTERVPSDHDAVPTHRTHVAAGVSAGDPLLVDVATPGFAYGLCRPGERVVYRAADPPRSSLADIARDLDG